MSTSAPFISVVIPVRDEGRYLRRCLEAVLGQDYPAERMEILIVDGRSTDNTREIVRELASTHSRLRLLDNPARRIPHALNLGIRAARGELIVRVNGHAVLAPDYVTQCVRALNASGADNVGGSLRSEGEGFWGEAIATALASPFARPGPFYRSSKPRDVDTVCLGAFRRDTLERVALFDESIFCNEDYELNYRIRRAGGRIHYTPDIKFSYYSRDSLWALAKQYWSYGRGKAVVLRRHPESVSTRHLAAPLFVLALAGGLARAAGGRPLPVLALLALYGGVSAFFSTRAAGGRGPRTAAAVALAFACMHLSWGTGLIVELVGRLASPGLARLQSMRRACPTWWTRRDDAVAPR